MQSLELDAKLYQSTYSCFVVYILWAGYKKSPNSYLSSMLAILFTQEP